MSDHPSAKTLAALVGSFLFVTGPTAHAKVEVGEPAPKIQVGQWIQGEPVERFDAQHIYIIDFWATWCGPCIVSIPHLNELAQKFKDRGVIVIGQNVWDQDDAVAPFVKKMGDKMRYRVALDDKTRVADGFMAENWWKRGVDHHGIPTAFIIDKQGRVVWIGHPMNLDEKLIEDVLADKFGVTQFAAEYQKQQQDNEKLRALAAKLSAAINQKNWQEAGSTLDEILRTFPELRARLTSTRFTILLGQKKFADAWALAEMFSDTHLTDVSGQNDLAWAIVAQPLEQRNLDLAEKLAGRANQAAHGTNAEILDTLARVQFMRGEKKEAVETEQKAVDASLDEKKSGFQKALTMYRHDQLPDLK